MAKQAPHMLAAIKAIDARGGESQDTEMSEGSAQAVMR